MVSFSLGKPFVNGVRRDALCLKHVVLLTPHVVVVVLT
jgi:hypothetical protein